MSAMNAEEILNKHLAQLEAEDARKRTDGAHCAVASRSASGRTPEKSAGTVFVDRLAAKYGWPCEISAEKLAEEADAMMSELIASHAETVGVVSEALRRRDEAEAKLRLFRRSERREIASRILAGICAGARCATWPDAELTGYALNLADQLLTDSNELRPYSPNQ